MAARTSADSVILCPGEEAWELWQCANGKTSLIQGNISSPKVVKDASIYGVPVAAAYGSPFWTPSIEPEMVEAATELQLEKMNLKLDDGLGRLVDTVTVEQTDGTLQLISVLNEKALPGFTKEITERYELTPNLFYLPDNEIVLWKELGKIVVCISRLGRPIHFQALNSSTVDAQVVYDLQVMLMPLEMQGVVTELDGIRLWTEAVEPNAPAWLSEALDLRVTSEAKATPASPERRSILMPNAVAQAKVDRQRAARIRNSILAAAAVWVAAAAAFVWWCREPIQQAALLKKELAAKEASLSWIDPEKARWGVVSDIANGAKMPMERFFQSTKMLNDGYGVRIVKWAMDTTKITIDVEAIDQNRAFAYAADIKKEPFLGEYQWDAPQPTAQRGDVCKMKLTGTLKSAAPSS